MAAAAINLTKLSLGELSAAPTGVAVDADDGALISAGDAADHKTVLHVENTAAAEKTLVIKKGDGIQGVADLTVVMAASAKGYIAVESMKYLITTGANKGKILCTGPADIKLSVIALP